MRNCEISRKTKETDIFLKLNIDGSGITKIDTGCGFLDHMLTLFGSHGNFDLEIKCVGDTYVDYHHTAEDIGIVLGDAFNKCLGDKAGINRYGSMILPMDESLILSAIDFSGRDYLGFDCDIPNAKVGDFDTELVSEFWYAFVRKSNSTLHIKKLAGTNTHHIIEGIYKSVARSIRAAVKIDKENEGKIPSTKGIL